MDEFHVFQHGEKIVAVMSHVWQIGLRKPSVKKSVRARTTGRVKRSVKGAVIPWYGKKGVGFVKNPKRSVKGAIYRRTTFGWRDLFR